MNTSPEVQQVEPKTQTEAPQCESGEHSRNSRNPTDCSISPSQPNPQLQQVQREEVIWVAEDNLITFTPLPVNTQGKGQEHLQHKPKEQRIPRRKTQNGDWRLNQKHFNQSKHQEISHISPVEQVNGFNIEEPSMSYLQLPTGRAVDPKFCSKCGKPGHWEKYCQATTWCRFCTSGTHSTRACRKYTNFVKDNPLASSRRTTPEHPVKVQLQQGFPQPPRQCFQAPVVPSTDGGNRRYPVQQFQTQRSSQDVRADPHFRHPPPHYSQLPLHRQIQTPPVEVNELGPTIQQGVIQRPVGGVRSSKETRLQVETGAEHQSERNNDINLIPRLEENIRSNTRHHSIKVFPEGYQLALNEMVRPVFVNHYYAGEAVVSGTNKKYIRLDDCDVLSECVPGIQQTQAVNREFAEHSQESLTMWCPLTKATNVETTSLECQIPRNVEFHSEFPEQLQNSLKNVGQKKTDHPQTGGIHSEYRESLRHSPDTMNVGRSRVQAASCVDPKHIPLTGYEQYHQEVQTYPVTKEPLNVQPTTTSDNSALMDLPNVQTGLPMPLTPQQVNQPVTINREERIENPHHIETGSDTVTSTQILESIQNITKIMQQQLIFNGKTTEAGILQTASLFQEMIKAQEKRDLDPAFMAIPTFLGQATDRPQCLDWLSRVKNVCDHSGRSFRQELINKSGILVQNSIRSLSNHITNKELTEKILQFLGGLSLHLNHLIA